MTREILERLGISLPLLPTTSVGSFPRTDGLIHARRGLAQGKIAQEEVFAAVREATTFWIKVQEDIGLDVLVDGEQLITDRMGEFISVLEGFEKGGLVRLHGNRYVRRPVIVSGIEWKRPISVEHWTYAQSLTSKPVKAILPGPCTVADLSFSDYYPEIGSACKALAEALRAEIEALISSGAKLIQIDEPVLSYRPNLLPVAIESFERMLHDQNAYFIVHICTGKFDALHPSVFQLPVHNVDLEIAHGRSNVLEVLRREPVTKDIGVGVIDVQNRRIEEFRNIRDRMRKASAVIPQESMWIAPDCGMKNRTQEETIAKLRGMVEAARTARHES